MKLTFTSPVLLGLLFILPSVVSAVPLNLFNTGVDAAGNSLAGGSADSHFTVLETGSAAQVMSYTPSSYLPNNDSSAWIWENASGLPTNVIRTFRTTFDLTGFDLSSVVIDGSWGTDNLGLAIVLNGVSTGITLPAFSSGNFVYLHDFSIASGFLAGLNTLDFVIQDLGVISGFRAELMGNGVLQVSEATSLVLLLAGLFGFGVIRCKQV